MLNLQLRKHPLWQTQSSSVHRYSNRVLTCIEFLRRFLASCLDRDCGFQKTTKHISGVQQVKKVFS